MNGESDSGSRSADGTPRSAGGAVLFDLANTLVRPTQLTQTDSLEKKPRLTKKKKTNLRSCGERSHSRTTVQFPALASEMSSVCLSKRTSCSTTRPAPPRAPGDPCLESLRALSPTFQYLKSQTQIKNERLTSKRETGGASVMRHSASLLDLLQGR